MDEVGVWDRSPALRTYTSIDDPEPWIKQSVSSNGRDTFVACISNSGFKLPIFGIKHQLAKYQTRFINGTRSKILIQPKVAVMSLLKMMEWCQEFVQYAASGDILIWDNLSCHKNPNILKFLKDHSIKVLFTPPYSACSLSPLDNSLFSQLKAILRRKKAFKNYEQKKHNVQLGLDQITEQQIKKVLGKLWSTREKLISRTQKSAGAFGDLIIISINQLKESEWRLS